MGGLRDIRPPLGGLSGRDRVRNMRYAKRQKKRSIKRRTIMAKHEHGKMDIRDHEKTFAGFIRLATWGAGISIVVLIFLALTNS
jgi:hypothetical protein